MLIIRCNQKEVEMKTYILIFISFLTISCSTIRSPEKDQLPASTSIAYQENCSNQTLKISWNNPNNSSEVILVRNIKNDPVDITDGTPVYQGSEHFYLDEELTDGEKYFYSIFLKDENGDFQPASGLELNYCVKID